jgi:hypothetical protein
MRIIVFENDEEFEEFAILPNVHVVTDGDREYFDWYFTPEYNAEVLNNTLFYMKDRNSKVLRRNACTFNVISKPVKNIKPYNMLIAKSSNPEIEVIEYKDYYKNI